MSGLIETYWEKFPGRYLTGDGAVRDTDGYYWVIGRVDDTLSVAGHRIGTAEVESALVQPSDRGRVGCRGRTRSHYR